MTESAEIYYIDDEKQQGDETLNIVFSKKVTEDGKEVDYITIIIPGNTCTVVEEPVNDLHKARFRDQWKAYVNLKTMTGTPIEQWEGLAESNIKEFKRQEFNFIEQIANAPDSSLQSIMGGPTWRIKARKYLDSKKITPEKIIESQQNQIVDQQNQIEMLQKQMAEVLNRLPKTR